MPSRLAAVCDLIAMPLVFFLGWAAMLRFLWCLGHLDFAQAGWAALGWSAAIALLVVLWRRWLTREEQARRVLGLGPGE